MADGQLSDAAKLESIYQHYGNSARIADAIGSDLIGPNTPNQWRSAARAGERLPKMAAAVIRLLYQRIASPSVDAPISDRLASIDARLARIEQVERKGGRRRLRPDRSTAASG